MRLGGRCISILTTINDIQGDQPWCSHYHFFSFKRVSYTNDTSKYSKFNGEYRNVSTYLKCPTAFIEEGAEHGLLEVQLYSPYDAGHYIPKDIGRNQCHLMGNVVFELTQGLWIVAVLFRFQISK